MPNKRNGIYKGKPKLDFRGFSSEDSHCSDFGGEGMATDPRLQEENLNFLLDMFRSVDKEIILAILLGYNGNMNESITKLREIAGEYSNQQMAEKAETDLAVIACSLLIDESLPVGTSRLDIYDSPEGSFNDLGSAALPDAVLHDQENSDIDMRSLNSATQIHESSISDSSGKPSSSSVSSRNGINEFSHKYAFESLNSNVPSSEHHQNPELNNVESFLVFRSKLNDRADLKNVLERTRNGDVRSDCITNLFWFQNSAISTTNNDFESHNLNTGGLKTDADLNKIYTMYEKYDYQESSSSFAEVNLQRSVINNEFCKIDAKKKPEVKVMTANLNESDDQCLNSLSKTSCEWDKFYSNFEPDILNAYYESMMHVDVGETFQHSVASPPVTLNTSHTPDSSISSENKLSSGLSKKNIPRMKLNSSQGKDPVKTASQLDCDSAFQSSMKVLSLAAANNSRGIQVSSSLTSVSSGVQSIKSCSLGTENSHDNKKKISIEAKLSANALEFIPRRLANLHSKPLVQNKIADVTAASKNQKSSVLEALKSPGKKKGNNAKKGKENNSIKANSSVPRCGLNQYPPPLMSWDYTSSFEDARYDVKTLKSPEAKKDFDPTDPLGWGDIFCKLTSSPVDPKPQRSKKRRNFSGDKSNQQAAPTPAFPPWQMDSCNLSGGSKLNVLPDERPTTSFTTSSANTLSSIHETKGTPYISDSETGNSSEHISRTQRLGNSPVVTRLPPSLIGRAAPAAAITKVNPCLENGQSIPCSVSSPKKVQTTLQTRAPLSSPAVSTQAELLKNRLQFRGVKTPVGVIRRYILEKQPVMIILRGLPGSGKSYLANQLIAESQRMGVQGIILSTDDYFMGLGQYCFNRADLSDAHEWNKKRAFHCVKESRSPVIIDNTNTTMWELLPYAVLALEHSYDVQLFEPDTSWRMKVMELARKNSHGVKKERIKRMKERWESFTLDDVLKQASQSVASRKTNVIVPTNVTLAPALPAVQQKMPAIKQMTDSEKAKVTEVCHQKINGSNRTPSNEALGLNDWFVAQTQRSPKKKKQKGSMTKSPDKSAKLEITQDFLNQSLKKAMVNLLKMPPSQAADSPDSSDFSQSMSSSERNVSKSLAENKISITERQLSDESWNSDLETPTIDKSIHMFENELTESASDVDVNNSVQKEEATVIMPEVSSNLLGEFRPNEAVDASSQFSTSGSYHTVLSNSDISSYHTVDDDGEGLSAGMLSTDDIEDIQLFDQDAQLLQEYEPHDRDSGEFTPVAEDEMSPIYFEKMTVVSNGDGLSSVEDKQHDYEAHDISNGNISTVAETAQDCSRDLSINANGVLTQSLSTESASLLGHFSSISLPTSLEDSDNKQKTSFDSLIDKGKDGGVLPNISCGPSLVEYSDSDYDSDKELPLLQNGELIAPEKLSELHFDKCVSHGESIIDSLADNDDSESCIASETMSVGGDVDATNYFKNNEDADREYVREISVDRSTQSSEDSMMSGREQSPQNDGQTVTDSLQQKKKKKRIRKGRNSGPFIEDSLKMKSKTQNWNSFVVQSSGSSNSSGDSIILEPESPRVDTSSSAAQTDPYYFSIVHKLNSPAFNNLQPIDWTFSGVEVITSSSKSTMYERLISIENEADTVPFRKIGSTVDQSTVTDETLEKEEVDLETLQSCFPEYSRKQLEATMAICQNDLEWVTSHLLDSPALYDMEDDDEEVMKADMLKSEKELARSGTSKVTVKSLANMCTMLVRKANEVDADDLEMQVIKVGEGRLQKIEMFGRSRLHSLSQEDFGNPDYWPDDFVLDEVNLIRATHDHKKKQSNFRQGRSAIFQTSPFDYESTRQTSGLLSTLMKENEFNSLPQAQEKHMPESKDSSSFILIKPQETEPVTEEGTVPVTQPAVAHSQPVMPLEFLRHLESLYGPLHLSIDDGASGLILDDGIARKIYNCLKLQATKKTVLKNSDEQQLKSDEALARALQDEENSKTASNTKRITVSIAQGHVSNIQTTVPGWTNQNPSWMSHDRSKVESSLNGSLNISGESKSFRPHSVADTLHQLRGTQGSRVRAHKFQHRMPGTIKSVWYGARRRGPVDSLISIMEEEMAREEQQREQLHIIESTGDMEALATRIKRIELSHLFPSMGPDVLEDIFRSTGFSKEETIRVLQQSYNIAPVAMSQDKEDILNQLRKSHEDYQHVDGLYEDDAPTSEDREMTYDDLRNEARFCRQLAMDCQQQALRYKSDGMQGAALFYRQRAKKYKEDEQAANYKAAQVLFEKGSERLQVENTLDLHFYHLDEAINAVNAAIEMKEDEYKMKPDRKNSYLDIVTGWGRNSKNGKAKLKPAIIHHLWAKCFQYEERSPGMLRVYLNKKL